MNIKRIIFQNVGELGAFSEKRGFCQGDGDGRVYTPHYKVKLDKNV